MELNEKRIMLTGGTAGIGAALVERLAPNNPLLVIGRSERKLAELAKRYGNVDTYVCDLSRLEDLRILERDASAVFRGVEVLINNAAVQRTGDFVEDGQFSLDGLTSELALNLIAPALLSRMAGSEMVRSKTKGCILNVGSALALAPKAAAPVYCGTKAGLRALSRSLGYQFSNHGIKVLHAMLPLVDTGMTTGRGSGKLSAEMAAGELIEVIEEAREDAKIGKAKLLSAIFRVNPRWAYRILRDS